MDSLQSITGTHSNSHGWQTVRQEIALKIFQFLQPLSLYQCTRVCTAWKRAVFQIPNPMSTQLGIKLNLVGETDVVGLMAKLTEIVRTARHQFIEFPKTSSQHLSETEAKQKNALCRFDSAHENLPVDVTPALINSIYWPHFKAYETLLELGESSLQKATNFALMLIKLEYHAKELIEFFAKHNCLVENLKSILQAVQNYKIKKDIYPLIFSFLSRQELESVQSFAAEVEDEKGEIFFYLCQRYLTLGACENALAVFKGLGENHPAEKVCKFIIEDVTITAVS